MTLVAAALPSPARFIFVPACLLAAAAAGVVVAIDPLRGLAMLAVAALVAVSALLPEVATFVFLVAIYANLPAIIANTYGVPAFLAAASIGMLGIPLIRTVVGREPFVAPPPLVPLLAYVGVVLLSAAAASIESGERVGIVLTEGLLLFLLLTNAIRTVDGLRRAIWGLLLAGALMSVVTIHQALTDNYDSDYGGFAVVEQGFEIDLGGQAVQQPRAAGPVGEKNRYAQVLLVLLPLGIGRIKDASGTSRRLMAAAASTAIAFALVLTYSRGGVIAVAAMLLGAALLGFVRWRTLVFAGVVVLAVVVIAAPTFVSRVLSIGNAADLFAESGDEAEGAIVGRATSNLAAFNVLVDHPLLGVGPGLYGPYYSVAYANRLGLRHFDEPRRAHNLFLEVGAETGILGLVTFGAVLVSVAYPLLRLRRVWRRLNAEHANLVTAILLALLGYLASGMFLHLAYERYLWLLIALAGSAIWILTPRPATWYALGANQLRSARLKQ
jgi:putative inorganic carbon (HCO3(-)) transporter